MIKCRCGKQFRREVEFSHHFQEAHGETTLLNALEENLE